MKLNRLHGVLALCAAFLAAGVVTRSIRAPDSPLDAAVAGAAAQTGAAKVRLRSRIPSSPAHQDRHDTETRELRALAIRDPRAALAHIASYDSYEERDDAIARLVLDPGLTDPAAALDFAWQCDLGARASDSAGSVWDHLADRWAAADFPAALSWASQLPVHDHDIRRERILKRLAVFHATGDAPAAARIVAETMVPGPEQCEAAVAVLKIWAKEDPDVAAAWVDDFTVEGWRETAERTLAEALYPEQGIK